MVLNKSKSLAVYYKRKYLYIYEYCFDIRLTYDERYGGFEPHSVK